MKLSKTRKIAYGYLLLNTIIWGAGLPIVKHAFNEGLDPFRFLLYRYAIASIFAIPILIHFAKKTPRSFASVPKIAMLELFGLTLSLTLLYYGLTKTTSIETGLISTTTPIFITLGGILIFRDREESNEITGLIIAFVGTILLTLAPIITGKSSNIEFSLEGNLIILAQTVISALYFLLAKIIYKKLNSFFVTAVSFYVGFVSFLIINVFYSGSFDLLIQDIRLDMGNPTFLITSAYMAILGSIFALSILLKAQKMIEISESSLFSYLQPLVAIPISILWLGEIIDTAQVIALALIALGVYVASRRTAKQSGQLG